MDYVIGVKDTVFVLDFDKSVKPLLYSSVAMTYNSDVIVILLSLRGM